MARKQRRRSLMRLRALLCVVIVASPLLDLSIAAQEPVGIRAVRASAPIRVDGRLDDAAWRDAPVVSDFVQRLPEEGQPARQQTQLQVAYDDEAVYVAARLLDSEPERIVRRLTRRDLVADADKFSIFFDPHHDHLTGVEFRVTAAGVQKDAVIYNDVYQDDTWDAVWDSAVTADRLGWTVEMRIPFSQLRFPHADVLTWGVNAQRIVHRTGEESWLTITPSNESGLASRMPLLEGLSGIPPARHLELLPYVTARSEFVEPASSGNPFNDGSRVFGGAGMDLKYGISSNLTLDATVNPDFGQVEVDPAVVNLSASETFFEEKRPFFTEGSQILSRFGKSGASEYWSYFFFEPQLFYSRRIGRAPQAPAAGTHVDTPTTTTILGAAKLTGKTRRGWTLGVLDAVTGPEYTRVSDGRLARTDVQAEPLTNYFVGRAQHSLGSRAALGLLTTMVHREQGTDRLADQLVGQAYVGGVDGHVFLDQGRDWVISGGLAGSTQHGTDKAIDRLQRASQRYLQRPDAPNLTYDPTRTSLHGWTGNLNLNRNRGNVTVNAAVWGMSPGFDSNDAGFNTQSDRGGGHGQVLFRKLTPDRFTRTRQLVVAKWWTWNWSGDSQGDGVQAVTNLQFLNYWRYNLTLGWSRDTWDDRLTRGGPTTIRPGIKTVNTSIVSDTRKRLFLSAFGTISERNFDAWSHTFGSSITYQPSDAVSITLGPQVLRSQSQAQYLATVVDPLATATYGSRYVFGDLAQTEVSVPSRINVTLSPRLGVQVYLQPLVSVGDYGAITEFARPRTYDFLEYGRDIGTLTPVAGTSLISIDPDGAGPASPFRISQPDFNIKSLRVNAVGRWEFKPGSTLFVVWTRFGDDRSDPGDFQFGRDVSGLWGADPDDVFLIKVSYWIGR
jgi:hypothetical protein